MKVNRDIPTPYSIQLEPSEGCNLGCSFCGLQSIRDNGADADLGVHGKNSPPYRFASVDTIERVAQEIARLGWNPRIEYAMHGEPTMNPYIASMVEVVRKHLPKAYLMMTTNGGGLVKNAQSRVDLLFESGLNTLALDDYKHSGGLVDKVMSQLDPDLSDWRLLHYPAELEGNPHQRHNKKKLVIITDISDNTTGTHTLTNQGGSAFAATKEPLAERCAKPFRELSVRWDGNVAVCCDDWVGVYKIGNVNEMALDDIWYHPRFEAARRRLYASDRAFGPCRGCDVRTKRNGLLPDKLGKGEMAAADDESNRYIREAMRGKVFTIKLSKGE